MSDPDPNLQLTVVFQTDDPVALSMAKAALEEAGIEFAVTEDALTGYGFSPIINPPFRIQVAEGSVTQALEAIEGLSGSGLLEDPDEAS